MDHNLFEFDEQTQETTNAQPQVSNEMIAARLMELAKSATDWNAQWAYWLAAAELGNFEANMKVVNQGIVRVAFQTGVSVKHCLAVVNHKEGGLAEKKKALQQIMEDFTRNSVQHGPDIIPSLDRFQLRQIGTGYMAAYVAPPDMRKVFQKGITLGFPEAALLEAAFIVQDKNTHPAVNRLRRIDLCYQAALMCSAQEDKLVAIALSALKEESYTLPTGAHAKLKLFLLHYLGAPGIVQDTKKALDDIVSGVFTKEIGSLEVFNLLLGEIQQRVLQIPDASDVVTNERLKQVQQIQALFSVVTEYGQKNDEDCNARYKEIAEQIQKISASTTKTNVPINDGSTGTVADAPISTTTTTTATTSVTTAAMTTVTNGITNFLNNVTQTLQWQSTSSSADRILTALEGANSSNTLTDQEGGVNNNTGKIN